MNFRPDLLEGTIRFRLSVLLVLPKCSVFMWVLVKVLLSAHLYGWLCVCVWEYMLCLSPAWSWRSRTTAGSHLSAWDERSPLVYTDYQIWL